MVEWRISGSELLHRMVGDGSTPSSKGIDRVLATNLARSSDLTLEEALAAVDAASKVGGSLAIRANFLRAKLILESSRFEGGLHG